MKKKSFVLGMTAVLLSLSLAFAACGGDDDDTYAGIIGEATVSSFNSAFGTSATASSPMGFVTGDVQTLLNKLSTLSGNAAWDEGLSEKDIRKYLASEGLTQAQIDAIINKLNSDGYVLAYQGIGNGMVGVVGAYRE